MNYFGYFLVSNGKQWAHRNGNRINKVVRAGKKSAAFEWNVIIQYFYFILFYFVAILNQIKWFSNSFRLTAEVERFNTILTTMKTKYKAQLVENDESIRKLTQEKVIATKKNKELVSCCCYTKSIHHLPRRNFLIDHFSFDSQEERVNELQDELKDIEDLRQTVVSMMSKRKKSAKDKC